MGILNELFGRKKSSAQQARERLQIIISHERSNREQPEYIPLLRQEIVKVIAKYVQIDEEQVQVALGSDGNMSKLELNITLPEKLAQQAAADPAVEAPAAKKAKQPEKPAKQAKETADSAA